MKLSGEHVANINCAFKDVKSNNFINFIYANYQGLIVNSNKIASAFDLLVVESYIKNLNNIDTNDIQGIQLL